MSLDKYVKKRDFDKTAEPKSGKNKEKGKLKFVVQRHHASRLHYDFRLEMDGVLKSWAVPKGPSLNPKDKRLAMMVEDHPYDYRSFEGTIPAGEYGGGVVHIFDEGTYEAIDGGTEKDLKKGLLAGNLKFSLHGKVLRGEFALVRLKNAEDHAWLLIKHKDDFAVSSIYTAEDQVSAKIKKEGLDFKKQAVKEIQQEEPVYGYTPMLTRLSDKIFDDPEWVYEKKLDGYRALAYISAKGEAALISRNGIDFSDTYKQITTALKELCIDAVLDGELVVEDKNGKSYFQQLQNYDVLEKKMAIKFYVFDLLSLNGHDLCGMELFKRKDLLEKVLEGLKSDLLIFSTHVREEGKALYERAEKEGWEGIIAKNGKSTYQGNARSGSWLKFKFQHSQEAVILGYLSPQGSRRYFGALVLGIYEGSELVYIGNCGTGFNAATLKSVHQVMVPLETSHKPVKAAIRKEENVTWIKPVLVCEVTYAEWTADGNLRHPVFKGLRIDKKNEEVVKEDLDVLKDGESTAPELKEKVEVFGKRKVKLTNLSKIYWKEENITKGQMIRYYDEMADYILPHLHHRPLSLNRHPDGADAPGFFQKDLDLKKVPSWIKSAPLFSDSTDKNIDYLICNDKATLLWMANLGCIEINPWISTYKKPERPLFAVMDLDPHDIDFREVIAVAQTIKAVLDKMKIQGFIKTSGSKGLHIFIPIGTSNDYDVAKDFIHYLGQIVHSEHPGTTSLERSPSKRKHKIYLDYLQNRRGQTIVAPYSLRPKRGATVSAPLEWDEVNSHLSLKDYTIFNMAGRMEKKGDLWKDILGTKNNLIRGLKLWKSAESI
ncbi:DNA ligase D [Pedobacter sp. AW31-3R]|uniref:DNA ligase D n=1 Tax=Pedobacter sp. AW31-3R TaxID=3445781 RepID=UPI003F9F5099